MKLYQLSVVILVAGCHGHSGPSRVEVVYTSGFDAACSLLRGNEIKEKWKAELVARKQEFTETWPRVGPDLFRTAEVITGNSFPSGVFTARLTLCDLASQSIIGISVNMRKALASFAAPPAPMRYKVDTLFHELLHRFMNRNPAQNSALLAEHVAEPWRVRNHLHLLALQKAVLLRLGEDDALKDLIAFDGQLKSGYYKRAWALVNATDTE